MPAIRVRPSRRRAPKNAYQLRATCAGLDIESEDDVLRLMEGCRLHPQQFPLLHLRVGTGEENRNLIIHGNVFVFEKQDGLKRWTDCRSWLGNEGRNSWLISPEAEKIEKVNSYGQRLNIDPRNPGGNRYMRPGLKAKPNGLLKRTMTLIMLSDPHKQNGDHRKIEIVSYIDPARLEDLRPVATDPILSGVVIPTGRYILCNGNVPLPRINAPGHHRTLSHRSTSQRTTLPDTPSLSPTTTLDLALSLSPATPYPGLSPTTQTIGYSEWSAGFYRLPPAAVLPSLGLRLPPIPSVLPPFDPKLGKRTTLPSLRVVLWDSDMPGEHTRKRRRTRG